MPSTDLVDEREIKRQIRVLLVDDQEMIRAGWNALLSDYGDLVIVAEASNGEEAVRICHVERPDIVLMDLHMPRLNGIEATTRIKQHFQSIAVLMLTSADSEHEVFAAFAAGADGYCLKDAPPDRLRTAILSVLDGAAWIDPQIARRVMTVLTGTKITQQPVVQKNSTNVSLTSRELEVLNAIVNGLSNADIAASLVITIDTTKTHVRHIMAKLAVSDRTQAAVKALRDGLIAG